MLFNFASRLLFQAAVSCPTVEPTADRIDYSRLREKERILFYDEVLLYEDELDDNGCTKLSCKIVSYAF